MWIYRLIFMFTNFELQVETLYIPYEYRKDSLGRSSCILHFCRYTTPVLVDFRFPWGAHI